MTESILSEGTQFVFADHAGDFSPDAKTSLVKGGATNVQFQMASVLFGAGRESAKIDLGVNRHNAYSVMASLEFNATGLVSGEVVEFHWAPSPIAAAANGNPMSIDGVDAAAPSGIGDLAELLFAIDSIGDFQVTDDATTLVQTAKVGVLVPTERYGILIMVNESGASMHSDDVEMHVVFDGIKEEQI